MPQKLLAIVPAAGTGSRMSSSQPKQFMEVNGKPILVITLETLINTGLFERIIIPTIDITYTQQIIHKFLAEHKDLLILCNGGKSRQESIYKALQEAKKFAIESEFTLVHDAARALINAKTINAVVNKAIGKGAASAARPVTDTLKLARASNTDYIIEKNISRENLWAMQTPQVFKSLVLFEAHQKAQEENFNGTDCCTLVENLGQEIYLVESPMTNMKITTPDDISFAERLLS